MSFGPRPKPNDGSHTPRGVGAGVYVSRSKRAMQDDATPVSGSGGRRASNDGSMSARGRRPENMYDMSALRRSYDTSMLGMKGEPFKARPIPKTTFDPHVPPKPVPPRSTTPKPFELRSSSLHTDMTSWHQSQDQEKRKQEEEARNFHASPVAKGVYNPFRAKKGPPKCTTPDLVPTLQSDKQHEKRLQWEEEQKKKAKARAKEEREEAKQRAEEDAAALKELRKSQTHKPRPMPDFSSVWRPDTAYSRGEIELHDWNAIIEQRKSEEKKREQASKTSGLVHKAIPMPDFNKVWEPDTVKHRSSPNTAAAGAQRAQSARQSHDGKAWGTSRDMDPLWTPPKTPGKVPRVATSAHSTKSPLSPYLASPTASRVRKPDEPSPVELSKQGRDWGRFTPREVVQPIPKAALDPAAAKSAPTRRPVTGKPGSPKGWGFGPTPKVDPNPKPINATLSPYLTKTAAVSPPPNQPATDPAAKTKAPGKGSAEAVPKTPRAEAAPKTPRNGKKSWGAGPTPPINANPEPVAATLSPYLHSAPSPTNSPPGAESNGDSRVPASNSAEDITAF